MLYRQSQPDHVHADERYTLCRGDKNGACCWTDTTTYCAVHQLWVIEVSELLECACTDHTVTGRRNRVTRGALKALQNTTARFATELDAAFRCRLRALRDDDRKLIIQPRLAG